MKTLLRSGWTNQRGQVNLLRFCEAISRSACAMEHAIKSATAINDFTSLLLIDISGKNPGVAMARGWYSLADLEGKEFSYFCKPNTDDRICIQKPESSINHCRSGDHMDRQIHPKRARPVNSGYVFSPTYAFKGLRIDAPPYVNNSFTKHYGSHDKRDNHNEPIFHTHVCLTTLRIYGGFYYINTH